MSRRYGKNSTLAGEGLEKIFKAVSKKMNENRMPKKPEEIIALRDQMVEEERVFQAARRAQQEIINMRAERRRRREYAKEADKAVRLYRRQRIKAKIRGVLKSIKDVHE